MTERRAIMDPTPAPDFVLEDLSGHPVHLSDFRGRPLVLTFLRGFS